MRAVLLLPLLACACASSPQPPGQAAIASAVAEALGRRACATRLVDQRIGQAEAWRMDAIETVRPLGEARPDNGTGAWRVRVAIRGTWSGKLPVATPAARQPRIVAGDDPPSHPVAPASAPPAIQYRQTSVAFDRTVDVRLLVDADGGLTIP